MITSFIVDSNIINVTNNGQISEKRDTARVIKGGACKEEEKLKKLAKGLDKKKLQSYKYINSIFKTNPLKQASLKALAKLFAKFLGEPCTREVYRCIKHIYMWMEPRMDRIACELSKKKVIAVINGEKFELTPPILEKKQKQCYNDTITSSLSNGDDTQSPTFSCYDDNTNICFSDDFPLLY